MAFLDKLLGRNGDPTPPPGWATFFKPGGYAQFEEQIRADLGARGYKFELFPEEGYVRLDHPDLQNSQLGLGNVAQHCAQNPPRRTKEIIKNHFDLIFNNLEERLKLTERFGNFDEARKVIKVRLYPADISGRDFMVKREPAFGLLAALVLDLPQEVASVHKEDQFNKWGLHEDEVFAIALQNVKEQDKTEPQRLDVAAGASVNALIGDSFFTASRALMLGDYLPPESELGAIAAIPHRHVVVFHPIIDSKALHAITAMIPMAAGMFNEGPGSISPHLYWWQDGKLQMQPSHISEKGIEFEPTEEFLYQALNKIREP